MLRKHLEVIAAKNAIMISKTTQEQLIRVCGDYIMDQIIKNVKESKYYSVLADETTDPLVVFIELYDAVIQALEKISISCDGKTGSSATEPLAAVSKFSFLAALMSAEFVLHYTKPLSVMLQKSGLDLCQAMHEVKTTQATLNDVRVNVDKRFKEIYDNIVKLASISGTDPSVPRTCGKQTMRINISTNDPVVYYRQSVFIPFLDNMIKGLEERFSPSHSAVALASKLVPSVIC